MARMTNAQLLDENARLREHANHLETRLESAHAQLRALTAAHEELRSSVAEQLRAPRPAPARSASRPVRTFMKNGVLMGKFPCGFNQFTIREVQQ